MLYCLAPFRSTATLAFRKGLLDFMASDSERLSGNHPLDPQALSSLHDQHYAELFRYARYRLGDSDAAEDAASETFMRLLEALQRGRGPRTSTRGWLFGTLRHIVDDHYRAAYARGFATVTHPDQDDSGPDAAVETGEREGEVRRALRFLTSEQQHVLALRFGGGYTLEETAEMMGRKANAIKALQFRALQSLRRHLTAEPE
jgi:RNA polymerase sigma-70 factor (ECF subfamily)